MGQRNWSNNFIIYNISWHWHTISI